MSFEPEPIDYDLYAKMDYWTFDEAIKLTVCCKLNSGSYDSEEEYMIAYAKEKNKLEKIVIRSIESGTMGEFHVVYSVKEENIPLLDMSCVTPYFFVKWVTSKGYCLSQELMRIERSEFSISDIESVIETKHNNYMCGIIYDENIKVKESCNYEIGKVQAVQEESVSKGLYVFEKTAQSWDIKFDSYELRGVKNFTGMSYIKLMLQNPGHEFGVIELQTLLSSGNLQTAKASYDDDFVDEEGMEMPNGGTRGSWERIDTTAEEQYRNRLIELAEERREAEESNNVGELAKINRQVDLIEEQLVALRHSKTQDPELEANRKKIYKNIRDAINNIKKLEEEKGYKDTPISEYLKCHIVTGLVCKYIPPKECPPAWTF